MWKKFNIACKCNGLRLVYWHFPVATQVILKFEEYLDMGLSGLGTSSVHRWRWVLYVVLALFGGSLTFVGARAQQKATEEATFRKLIDDYCAAWSSGNPDNAAKFYSQE